jgi:hypothetical protein
MIAQADNARVAGQRRGEDVDLGPGLVPGPARPDTGQRIEGLVRVLCGGLGVPLKRGEPGPLDAQVEPSAGLVLAELAELLERGVRLRSVAEIKPCGGGVG